MTLAFRHTFDADGKETVTVEGDFPKHVVVTDELLDFGIAIALDAERRYFEIRVSNGTARYAVEGPGPVPGTRVGRLVRVERLHEPDDAEG